MLFTTFFALVAWSLAGRAESGGVTLQVARVVTKPPSFNQTGGNFPCQFQGGGVAEFLCNRDKGYSSCG